MQDTKRSQAIKLIPVGNSKGIRIPKSILQKYGFCDLIVLEETEEGLLLRKPQNEKLSWENTYRAMAAEDEDWSDFDITLLDGLEEDV